MHGYDGYETMTVERRGPILTIVLDRPEAYNAVNARMHEELSRIFVDVKRDPGARVVVLTGRGKAFCGGGDIDWIVFDGKKVGDISYLGDTAAVVSGGGGRDHFVFTNPETAGAVVIEDFSTREKLDFSALFDALGYDTAEERADAGANILSSVRDTVEGGEFGADGTYVYSHGVTIILEGVSAESLSESNFIF